MPSTRIPAQLPPVAGLPDRDTMVALRGARNVVVHRNGTAGSELEDTGGPGEAVEFPTSKPASLRTSLSMTQLPHFPRLAAALTNVPSVPVSHFPSHGFGAPAVRPRPIFASMSEELMIVSIVPTLKNIASSPVTSPQACPDAINAVQGKMQDQRENKRKV